MNGQIDTYLHIIGGELLVIFALVLMLMDNNSAKQIISKTIFTLVGLDVDASHHALIAE